MMYKDKRGWLFRVVWHYEGCLKGGWRAYYKHTETGPWHVIADLPNCWSRGRGRSSRICSQTWYAGCRGVIGHGGHSS